MASDAPPIRVLLVDDHLMVREGLRHVLAMHRQLVVVAEAGDGLDAIEKTQSHRPDVVVMDINMPRLNGIQATRRIKSMMPAVRVVMLSMHNDARIQREALDAGAVAYVTKDAAAELLCDTILNAPDTDTSAHDAAGAHGRTPKPGAPGASGGPGAT